jgi:chemotaxis methyl-accepting protein methylase/signal transduction histidine kinase
VDHVAELDAIGPLLYDLVLGSALPERPLKGAHEAMPEILALITRQSTIDFRPYKPTTILRRIGRRMAVTHTRTIEEYRDYLQSHPAELAELVMALLIKVTEFFRDPEAFAYMRRDVVPDLIARRRDQGRVLRLWSAGCATGEEAYSLALMVADALGGELPEWSVKVFATDVDESAIHYARRGFYPANVVGKLPEALVTRYFEPSDQGVRVSKVLRQLVIFGQQDITRGVPFPRVDLVVCRNLLIYFKPELQEEVLDIFAYSLHQTNGYLLLGKAETARPSRATFELVNKKWKVYRCIHGPLPAAVKPGLAPAHVGELAYTHAEGEPAPRPAIEAPPEADLSELRHVNELMLRGVMAGIVVVDRHYRILSINAAARRLLGIRESGTAQDFLHTVRGLPYEEARGAIDRAFRERATASVELVLASSPATERRHMAMHVSPPPTEAAEYVIITVLDVTDRVQAARKAEALQNEHNQLAEELGTTNRRLTETNKELQDANEELQAANEELMLAQEELQATNEEFEATNEELQATNEELETNNEELQATNEELETTNEELQARTAELQELNRILTGERARLSEMVEQAPLFIVMLRGPALVVEASNPSSLQLFGGQEAAGRPFEEVCRDPALEPLVVGVREVFHRDRPWKSGTIVTAAPAGDRPSPARELVYTVVPSHDAFGRVDGVMVYAEDVSEKRAAEDRERAEMLKLMIEHAYPAGLGLYDTQTGQLLQASPRYTDILRRLAPRGEAFTRSGFTDLTLLPNGEEARQALASLRRDGEPVRIAELRRRLPGDERDTVWDWTLIPISHGEGAARQTRHAVVCVFEVTEQVQWLEEMKKLDALREEFLAMASHELRTPLVPLTTYVDVLDKLLQEPPGPQTKGSREEASRLVSRVRKQIGDLTRLTDDLLDVSRLQSGSFAIDEKPVDLRQVVEDAREMASRLPDAPAIRVSSDGDRLVVKGDEGRLVQAVFNLLSNAVRYGGDGDAIDLRLAPLGSGSARIEVKDYGPGIAAEDQKELFTRFYRGHSPAHTARAGLGLGLFICRQIVERHGGTIGVRSQLGQGSSFTIELPLAASGAAAAGTGKNGPRATAKRSGRRSRRTARQA